LGEKYCRFTGFLVLMSLFFSISKDVEAVADCRLAGLHSFTTRKRNLSPAIHVISISISAHLSLQEIRQVQSDAIVRRI
jgi:hypothetical protein